MPVATAPALPVAQVPSLSTAAGFPQHIRSIAPAIRHHCLRLRRQRLSDPPYPDTAHAGRATVAQAGTPPRSRGKPPVHDLRSYRTSALPSGILVSIIPDTIIA